MKERAKFMPENKVFGQAEGGGFGDSQEGFLLNSKFLVF
jgi:hypothetical protein